VRYSCAAVAVLVLVGALLAVGQCTRKRFVNTVVYSGSFDGKVAPFSPSNIVPYDEAVKWTSYWVWEFGLEGEVLQATNIIEGKPHLTIVYIYSDSILVGEHVTEHWCQHSFTTMFHKGGVEREEDP